MGGPTFAVLGTGHSGHAFAADLSLRGFSVHLGDLPQFSANIAAIQGNGGIQISGEAGEGFARPRLVTADLAEAIEGAEVIIIAAPAFAHEPFSRALAPYFADGQFIVLVSNFGALRFRRWMEELGVGADVTPVETMSLPYACRSTAPGTVEVKGVKSMVPTAALPAGRTGAFLDTVSTAFPQMVSAGSVLATSLNNLNPIVHPPMVLLNAGRIEATGGQGWNLYGEGATESVVKVMLGMDAERLALVDRLGIVGIAFEDAFDRFYPGSSVGGGSLSQVLRTSPIHAHPAFSAPGAISTRYVTEDVPFGLVPWSSMGDMWGIATPTLDAMIQVGSVMLGVEYFREGITVRDLGIDGLSPEAVRAIVDCDYSAAKSLS